MELRDMTIEQLEERKSAILKELENDNADLDALEKEARAIKEEIESRKNAQAKKEEVRKMVASNKVQAVTIQKIDEERNITSTNEEIRASKEYIEAFARYLISENDSEVRALLTENVSGSVPVPSIVDDIIRTAWEKNEILSRVRKTDIRGNLRVPFELSADGAWEHTEGTTAPTEESLELGIVEMIPKNVKKWIRISDEVVAMGGETLVNYVYKELTYRIIKKLTDLVVNDIKSAPTSATSSKASAEVITAAPSITTISDASDKLSDEATNLVVIMNKLTRSKFVAARAAGNFAIDPFDGLPVLFNNSLPAYDSASANQVYAIVGDLDGAQANYPEGEGIIIKWDDLSESEDDLVKVVGRQYVAHAVTACGRFCNIKKPSTVTT